MHSSLFELPSYVVITKKKKHGLGKRGGIIFEQEIAALLEKLDFACHIEGDKVLSVAPPYRLDIGEGVVGQADARHARDDIATLSLVACARRNACD